MPQNSRAENRQLFGRVHAALAPGGRILLRDLVMAQSRIAPPGGAKFAVNMLVATPGGGTFTLAELEADLNAAGFNRWSRSGRIHGCTPSCRRGSQTRTHDGDRNRHG